MSSGTKLAITLQKTQKPSQSKLAKNKKANGYENPTPNFGIQNRAVRPSGLKFLMWWFPR